jgi:hypothetical protein
VVGLKRERLNNPRRWWSSSKDGSGRQWKDVHELAIGTEEELKRPSIWWLGLIPRF